MYLGPEADIYPPAGDNTEGFWENKNFVEINNQILAEFGGSWDLPPAMETGWHKSDRLSDLEARAKGLIDQFNVYKVWGWKDPRNSFTLPFWQELIPELKVAICLRNPYEVAQSLSKRGYTSNTFSYHLWQSYYQNLISILPAGSYIITHYDAYFIDPKAELLRLLDFIGLSAKEKDIEEACKIASPSHKHNHSTIEDVLATKAPREVLQLYVEMCAQAGDVFWGKYAPDLKKTIPVDRKNDPELSQTGLLLRLNEKNLLLDKEIIENKTRIGIIKAKDETIRAKDETIRAKDEKIRHIQARLAYTEYDLRNLQDSLAVKFLFRYRKFVERSLPVGTKRRRLYEFFTRSLRVLLTEGPKGVWKRIQARRRAKVDIKNQNKAALAQKKAASGKTLISKQEKSANLRDQSRLAEIYSEALSVATGEMKAEYVPISQNSFSAEDAKTKIVAFYLPQFHPIPENNEWWGSGFTEWTNVAKAVPQYTGHYQPHLPGELGFYDLRLPEVQRRQVQLAKQYGIFGFSFYYYWFNGKRLLERPIDQFISDPEIDFPFCLCWANENWTRRWDGQESEILIGQNHSVESDIAFIKDVEPYLRHRNYIKVDGRPILIVYRPQIMPDPAGTAQRWKEYCSEQGLGDVYLVAAQTFGLSDPRQVGFDAAVEFPPHGILIPEVTEQVEVLNPSYAGKIYNYQHVVGYMMQKKAPDYPLFRTVMTSWDNTARRQNHAHIFINADPSTYQSWLSHDLAYTERNLPEGERFVFVNAWNEWAEGTHLEPDRKYGYAYLQSTMLALQSISKQTNTTVPGSSNHIPPFEKILKQHDTAVILHIYYPELWDEINSYLLNLQGQFDLFVSVPNSVKFDTTNILQHFPQAHIYRCENRGRDIAPFIKIFKAIYSANYQYICKIHTKKTTHRENGEQWRQDLLNKLLGSSTIVKEARKTLDSNIKVGFLAPRGHVLSGRQYMAKNEKNIVKLAQEARIDYQIQDDFAFVAGSMYWFKPLALAPLVFMDIKDEDFGKEEGLKDGTLAHAFERFIGLLVLKNGFQIMEIGHHTKNLVKSYDYAARMSSQSRREVSLNPIIVYQMGKVGSMSVVDSLQKTFKNLSLDIPVYHRHLLNNLAEIEQAIIKDRPNPDETLREIRQGKELRNFIEKHPEQKWNLISLVRDPVARNVATFFQNLPEIVPNWKMEFKTGNLDIGELQKTFLNMNTIHGAPDAWFDTQLKPVFWIDIFSSPFPVESGYKIYRGSSRANLLIVRLEDLDRVAQHAIYDFLGFEGFKIGHVNTTDTKEYAEIYQAFKELPLPHDYVERMYNTRFAQHFYSREELENFAKRWIRD
jgi:lipopolysaccharide biosynthesis protein